MAYENTHTRPTLAAVGLFANGGRPRNEKARRQLLAAADDIALSAPPLYSLHTRICLLRLESRPAGDREGGEALSDLKLMIGPNPPLSRNTLHFSFAPEFK